MKTINDLPAQVAAVNGDLAKLSLSTKLVDGLKTKDELRQMMIKRGAPMPKTRASARSL
jgi:protease-4